MTLYRVIDIREDVLDLNAGVMWAAHSNVRYGVGSAKGRAPAKEARPSQRQQRGSASMDSLAEAAIEMLRAHRAALKAHAEAGARLHLVGHHVVALARTHGLSWRAIAEALGMPSAEAARVRHYRGA